MYYLARVNCKPLVSCSSHEVYNTNLFPRRTRRQGEAQSRGTGCDYIDESRRRSILWKGQTRGTSKLLNAQSSSDLLIDGEKGRVVEGGA